MRSGGQWRHSLPAIPLFFFFYFDCCEVLSMLVAFPGLSDRSSSHLTDTRTHNLCLSFCIQPSGGSLCGTKLCQDLIFLLPSFVLSTLPQTFIFLPQSSALWHSVTKHTNINTHKARGRLSTQIALVKKKNSQTVRPTAFLNLFQQLCCSLCWPVIPQWAHTGMFAW